MSPIGDTLSPTAVFEKTMVGRAALKTRGKEIDQRCRSLLLLIDGKTPAREVIARLAGLGITGAHFQTLVAMGYVAQVVQSAQSVQTAPLAPGQVLSATAGPVPVAMVAATTTKPEPVALRALTGILPGADQSVPVVEPQESGITNGEKFIQVGNFMNQAAKDLMGLFAAIGFQQRVSGAGSLDDLRKLRQPMIDAITKNKGESFARGMAAELDRLLSLP